MCWGRGVPRPLWLIEWPGLGRRRHQCFWPCSLRRRHRHRLEAPEDEPERDADFEDHPGDQQVETDLKSEDLGDRAAGVKHVADDTETCEQLRNQARAVQQQAEADAAEAERRLRSEERRVG